MDVIEGNDNKGLKRAFKNFESISKHITNLTKERNELFDSITASGFKLDVISERVKEIVRK